MLGRWALTGLVWLTVAGSAAPGQTPETLAFLLQQNRLEEIKQRLPELVRKFPDDPTVLFLQGATEADGARAVRYYKRIVEDFPTSAFADDALLRMAEYDFALGLYHSSSQRYLQLAQRYPASPLCDDAYYMRIQCLLARGEQDSARYALEWFLNKYPNSPLASLAASEVRGQSGARPPSPAPRAAVGAKSYALQVGAFKEKRNAEKLVHALTAQGYECEMVTKERGRDLFYLVWVGRFENEVDARRKGEQLQARHGLPFRIVQR